MEHSHSIRELPRRKTSRNLNLYHRFYATFNELCGAALSNYAFYYSIARKTIMLTIKYKSVNETIEQYSFFIIIPRVASFPNFLPFIFIVEHQGNKFAYQKNLNLARCRIFRDKDILFSDGSQREKLRVMRSNIPPFFGSIRQSHVNCNSSRFAKWNVSSFCFLHLPLFFKLAANSINFVEVEGQNFSVYLVFAQITCQLHYHIFRKKIRCKNVFICMRMIVRCMNTRRGTFFRWKFILTAFFRGLRNQNTSSEEFSCYNLYSSLWYILHAGQKNMDVTMKFFCVLCVLLF